MTDAYVGEIRMFGGGFAPVGWLPCDGRLIPLSDNYALFAVLGRTWGGDGVNNFALPDLRGRLPVGGGQGTGLTRRVLGASGGEEAATVETQHLPAHSHALMASTLPAASAVPGPDRVYAAATSPNPSAPRGLPYVANATGFTERQLNEDTLGTSCGLPGGLAAAHDNRMPAFSITFIIATSGEFPVQD